MLPLLLYAFMKSGIFDESDTRPDSPGASPTKPTHTSSSYGSRTDLIIATLCGLVAAYSHSGSISVVALGLSHAILEVFAFNLIERANGASQHQLQNGGSVIYSASGLLTQPAKPTESSKEPRVSMIRDVSAAGTLATATATMVLESRRFGGLAYNSFVGHAVGGEWMYGQGILSVVYGVGIVIVHMVMFGALLMMVSRAFACVVCSLGKRDTLSIPPSLSKTSYNFETDLILHNRYNSGAHF